MSFQIFVFIPQAAIPMPANPHDWGRWARECSKKILLEEPLGSDGTVFTFWSSLAEALDLPLLAGMYHHGLHIETTVQLEALEAELDELETYWLAHILDEPDWEETDPAQLLESLQERLQHFRRATRLARETNAILLIEQPG